MMEVMDGVMNYVTAVHLIRSYSYEGIALLRALHQIRFFNRPAEKEKKPEKKQVELATMLVEKTLQYNSARAREGKHPATFPKILGMAKDILAERGIDDPNLQNGGAYTTFAARKEFNPLSQREGEQQKPKSSGAAGSGGHTSGFRSGQNRGRGGQGGGQRGRHGGGRGGGVMAGLPPTEPAMHIITER